MYYNKFTIVLHNRVFIINEIREKKVNNGDVTKLCTSNSCDNITSIISRSQRSVCKW